MMELKKNNKGEYSEMSIFWINVMIRRHGCSVEEAIRIIEDKNAKDQCETQTTE